MKIKIRDGVNLAIGIAIGKTIWRAVTLLYGMLYEIADPVLTDMAGVDESNKIKNFISIAKKRMSL